MPNERPKLEYGTADPELNRRRNLTRISIVGLCLGIWLLAEFVSAVNAFHHFYAPFVRPAPATAPSTGPTGAPSE